jgi:CSLREA domain-containing protein
MSQERVSHRCTRRPQPLVLALLVAALGSAAQAATFTVNSTADAVDAHPGDGVCATAIHVCTLRAAIQEANALAGVDIITVPAGTFTLTLAGVDEDGAATGDLDITDDLTLTGAGAAQTIIDGGGIDRVLEIFGAAANSPHVDIAKVTIANGAVQGAVLDGGGIWNSGTLTLTDSTLSDNTAGDGGSGSNGGPNSSGGIGQAGGSGGGLYNSGTLTLTNSILRRNTGGTGGTGGDGGPGGAGGPGGPGGGIYNSGTLTVTNSTLSQNTGGPGGPGGTGIGPGEPGDLPTLGGPGGPAGSGGGIANSGTLTVTNSTFSQNTGGTGGLPGFRPGFFGGPGGDGGSIWNKGSLTVTNSILSDNAAGTGGILGGRGGSGGGIWNSDTLTVSNTTLSHNRAGDGNDDRSLGGGNGGNGGGIYNSGTLTVINTTLSYNNAGNGTEGIGGGFDGGSGGGIYNSDTLTVTNSTLSQNTTGNGGESGGSGGGAGDGGGIWNSGTLTVSNTTLSQNHLGHNGFESSNPGPFGGGLYNKGPATLRNTILAYNTEQFSGGNCFGSVTDGGYNLASDTSCPFSAPTSLNNIDPLLLPLQDNGGPTATQALCTGPGSPEASCPGASPALDLIPPGINGCGTTIATDQRGVLRPQGPGCDMGAVEEAAALLPFAALRTQVTLYRNALSKLTPNTDHFTAQGAFTLDAASNGIAPPTEVVLFTLADTDGPFFTQTLPRGSFLPFGHGSFFFRAPVGQKGVQSLVLLGSTSAGHFSFSVTGDKLDLRGANHPPVTVGLQIGADTGAQTLACRKFKQGWRCQ